MRCDCGVVLTTSDLDDTWRSLGAVEVADAEGRKERRCRTLPVRHDWPVFVVVYLMSGSVERRIESDETREDGIEMRMGKCRCNKAVLVVAVALCLGGGTGHSRQPSSTQVKESVRE